ncbi:hypothetical protein VSU19_20085 [Verrucomicrobiales bacterium BCK34]|nr:hypothetical protein [Verrucomicrobiales bacterium BCK34]
MSEPADNAEPTSRFPDWAKVALIFGIPLIYGLLLRLLFNLDRFEEFFAIVSLSFVALVPITLGGLTTLLGIRFFSASTFWVFIAPMLTVVTAFVVAIITQLEAILCVVVAAPIYLPVALLSGWATSAIIKKRNSRLNLPLLVLLPLAFSPLESLWEQPHETFEVLDTIEIAAPPSEVWDEIASVPAINPDELPFQWIYWLDFPRPISAEIDKKAVGGKRLARFEREVSFFEVVTEWEEKKSLAFTIEADPRFIPHTAFDSHIIVGGRFYDVLNGRYEIEEVSPDLTRLHLTSQHRLSTPFNGYAGWWSEWVMRQVQGSILEVIKNRAEGRS